MVKKLGILLASLCVAMMSFGPAFAEQIGVVDIQRIVSEYNKGKTLTQQVQAKEKELQEYRASLANELKTRGEALSPVEKKNLEDELNQKFVTRFKEYRQWAATQQDTLEADLQKAVQAVAQTQQLDVVLAKPVVLQGGKDITQDVITQLNSGN
jgi:outer membrane protein